MADQDRLLARNAAAFNDIAAAHWDHCVPLGQPCLRHGFFSALEESLSAVSETGWQPCPVTLEDESGNIQAALPAYLKHHSYGEYVFDQPWANAYRQAGGDYYPKLQICVPFTPVPGPRLLAESAEKQGALLEAAKTIVDEHQLSGLHITFLTESELEICREHGLLIRSGQQFHWHNDNYSHFDDFLTKLASRKRKAIRRERREALAAGIEIIWLQGHDIEESHWDAFFAFYLQTSSRKWGQAYLTRRFFSLLGERLEDSVLLMLARRNGEFIAGALHLRSDDALLGRYWGCLEHHPFLHFELCYYQAIDYAIAEKLARVEAGAQGEHKLLRGYAPVKTYSAHWLREPRFHQAVERFLHAESQEVEAAIEYLGRFTPFRKTTKN